MALVKCDECGNQVSTDASACPHCGRRKGGSTFKWRLIGAVACAAAFIAFGIYTGHRSSQAVIDLVQAKMLERGIDGVHVEITSYVTVGNDDFTCGAAFYKDAEGVEQTVIFYGVQSSPLMTNTQVRFSGDPGFSMTYSRVCVK